MSRLTPLARFDFHDRWQAVVGLRLLMITTLIASNLRPGPRWDPHSKSTPRDATSRPSGRKPASSPPLRSARTPGVAYEGALRRLQDWLDGRTLDDSTLAEYLAVRFYAKLGGQASPVGPATARVLAGSSGGSVRGLRDTGACIGSLLNQTPAAKR